MKLKSTTAWAVVSKNYNFISGGSSHRYLIFPTRKDARNYFFKEKDDKVLKVKITPC